MVCPTERVRAATVTERAATVAAAAARAVASAAADAAAHALRLVVGVRRVTPRGVPVLGALVLAGGGVGVGAAHGEGDVTLSRAEVIPEL